MRVTPTPRDGDRLVDELVALVQHATSETMAVRDEQGLARLEDAWHRSHRPPGPARGRARLLVATMAAIALVVGGTAIYRHVDKLTYEVMNGTIGPGGFVNPTAGGTTIVFSEGSEITLDESARTRVEALTADGGRVVIETGTVHARIIPRKHAHWIVEAGPYTIRVTGTAFKVRWSSMDELLDVQMQRGSVVVTGPLAPSGVTLMAGMRLTANPGSGLAIGAGVATTAGDSHDAAPGSAGAGPANPLRGDVGEAAPAANETATRAGDSAALVTPNSAMGLGERMRAVARPKAGLAHRRVDRRVALLVAEPAPRPSEPWDKQLARGDIQGILADADERGVDRLLVSASGRDLSVLSDAARYGHRPALARRTLLTVRERFPRSPEARDAAFFLGGLAEDSVASGSGQMAALDWYRRYLSESPGGRYVAQALGRKMVMTQKLNGTAAARPVADEYLARFPEGPYGAAARKLAETP